VLQPLSTGTLALGLTNLQRWYGNRSIIEGPLPGTASGLTSVVAGSLRFAVRRRRFDGLRRLEQEQVILPGLTGSVAFDRASGLGQVERLGTVPLT
jgi:hypothetical protein